MSPLTVALASSPRHLWPYRSFLQPTDRGETFLKFYSWVDQLGTLIWHEKDLFSTTAPLTRSPDHLSGQSFRPCTCHLLCAERVAWAKARHGLVGCDEELTGQKTGRNNIGWSRILDGSGEEVHEWTMGANITINGSFCPPEIHMLKPNPLCDGIWTWRLREVIKSWGWWASLVRLVPL